MQKSPSPTAERGRPAGSTETALDLRQVVVSLGAGAISALIWITVLISLGALIFAGPLTMFIANGIGLLLAGTAVMAMLIAFFSSRPTMLAGVQDSPAVVVAVIAAGVARSLAGAEPATIYATALAAILVTSLATGVTFLLLGQFRLGSLVRYFPYPVTGGFLAGTGWLFLVGGFGIMTGAQPELATLPALFQPDTLWRWLPGVLFAFVILLIMRRVGHPLVLPGMIASGTLLYFLWLALMGIPVSEALGRGWLLGPFPEQAFWAPLTPAMLGEVRWAAVAGQAGGIATVVLISVVGMLLNMSGLQLALRADIDLNHELRAMGLAQILGGLAGGAPGYPVLSVSILSQRMGARSRLVGVTLGALCGLTLFFGAGLIALIPRVVLGGIIIFLGLGLLVEWLYDTWATLPRVDYAMVVAILALIIGFGVMPGVVAGLALAVILFVIAYSRIEVIKHTLDGAAIKSRVSRPGAEEEELRAQGRQIAILLLQGFIFFGTADELYERVRRRVLAPDLPRLRFVLLDFRLVPRVDSTAMLSFTRLLQLAEGEGLTLVLTQLAPAIRQQFEHGLLRDGARPQVRIFPDQDHGLEWCEEQLLTGWRQGGGAGDLWAQLAWLVPELAHLEAALGAFEQCTFEPGEYLMRKGDSPDDMFLVEVGQVTAQVVQADGTPVRLESMRAGRTVGELGFLRGIPRTADVVADEACSAYRITREGLRRLEREQPEAAVALNLVIARLLSERVVHLMGTVNALQQ